MTGAEAADERIGAAALRILFVAVQHGPIIGIPVETDLDPSGTIQPRKKRLQVSAQFVFLRGGRIGEIRYGQVPAFGHRALPVEFSVHQKRLCRIGRFQNISVG